jgi:hypothetical protein
MATCPRCGEFLFDGHQCRNPGRRRLRLGASIVVALGLGGSVSVALLFSVVGNPTSATVAVVAILGMIAGEAVRQAIP